MGVLDTGRGRSILCHVRELDPVPWRRGVGGNSVLVFRGWKDLLVVPGWAGRVVLVPEDYKKWSSLSGKALYVLSGREKVF